MDPVKVVIFVVAFLLLLFLGRKLSSSSESASIVPFPTPLPTEPFPDEVQDSANKLTVVGADLPFPIHVPEITRDRDGKYNRPEFLNYYFEETDLLRGPQDPASFYDSFYLETRDFENSHTALYKYFVATPLGLQKALADEKLAVLYLEEHSLIIARWDVPLILEAIVKQVIQAYAEANDNETHALPNPDIPEHDAS